MPWTPSVSVVFLLFLFFQEIPAHKGVTQEPAIAMATEGESVNITCNITKGKLIGMYLKRQVVNAMDVLYVSDQVNPTTHLSYKDRINSSVHLTEVRITLHQLQKNDTDVYVCSGSVLDPNSNPRSVVGQGTILVVKEMEQAECQRASWVLYFLPSMALILLFVLGYFVLSRIHIKEHCQRGKNKQANTVYEDMSYSLRRNTLATGNAYNNC
ncbi:T-cell antigen CD7 [Emydura macquarii macquarii]|uniref:T-cell antigen CD7 n=1 Tax=Emydura macquarii macquarii TaxID=1129001 RepID=UPI00352AA9C8